MKRTFFIIIALLFSTFSFSQSLNGKWKGEISIDTTTIEIIFNIEGKKSKPEITYDIPIQSAFGLKAVKSDYDKKKKSLIIDAGYGIKFDLECKNDSLFGQFLQMGYVGQVKMVKQLEKKDNISNKKISFKEIEVEFYNGENVLTGTLAIPKGNNPVATVVLVTGSGQQTRDENIYGFKVFKALSDSLANHNIMVLRYDDRGMGGSTGSLENATTYDFATDAAAAVNFLLGTKKYNTNKIGVIGHSEGGVIITLLNEMVKLDFGIMMAGPVLDGKSILLKQTYDISISSGMEEENARKVVNLNEKLYQSVILDTLWDESKQLLREYLIEQDPELSEDDINTSVEMQIAQLQTSWFKYFLSYDPSNNLVKHSDIPILALFGSKDTQVSAEQNIAHIKFLMKEYNIESQYITINNIKDANHLFQKAISGSPDEYKDLDKQFIDGFTDVIIEYINSLNNE